MEKKEVKIEAPVTVAGVTLIPVVQVSVHHRHGDRGFSFSGVKRVTSVVVVSASGKKAFGVN